MNRKNKWQLRLAGALLFFVLFSLYIFSQANRERIFRQNSEYIEDFSLQRIKYLNDVLVNAQNNIELISYYYGKSLTSPKVKSDHLKKLISATSFDYVEFTSKEGINLSANSQHSDASDRRYYQDGIQGNSGIDLVFDSRITGETLLSFYTPLYYEGEIIGVLVGIYRAENRLRDLLDSRFMDEEASAYLCTRDGRVVAGSAVGEPIKNVLSSIKNGYMVSSEDQNRLDQAAAAGTPFSFRYKGSQGQGNAYFAKLPDVDLYLLQTFPSGATESMIRDATSTGVTLEAALVIGFLLYILFLLLLHHKQEEQLMSENQEMSCIIQGIHKMFNNYVLIDLEQNTYRFLAGTRPFNHKIPSRGRYPDLKKHIVSLLVDDDTRAQMDACLETRCLKEALNGSRDELQYEYRLRRGSVIWEDMNIICLKRKAETPTLLLLTRQDVTQVKNEQLLAQEALVTACETAENASHAKSDFLSRMSHDIRTPLNGIIGMTELAAMRLDDRARVEDCLQKIAVSGQHLLHLVNEILDMSRIESGKLSLKEEAFAITDVIDNLSAIFHAQTASKNQDFQLSMLPSLHEHVIGDSQRLQQILINILGNAVKFTPDGGSITMTVSEEPISLAVSSCYKFIITDTGIGMSEEFIKHIFDPFSRAADSRTDKVEGTGLGMAIARNLARMMGGDIYVQSQPGKGSCFTVTVTLKLQKEQVREPVQPVCDTVPCFDGRHILLAEDNELNREIAAEFLQDFGLTVDQAQDGQEALDLLFAALPGTYDLILMDIQMPRINGHEAARAIRSSGRPDLESIPIIAMTANAFVEDIEKSRNAGMNDHLAKPISADRLAAALARWLSSDETSKS